jgi:uncharacterized protein (TIGR03437 family)
MRKVFVVWVIAACGLAQAQVSPEVGKLSAVSNGFAVYGATSLTLRGEAADFRPKVVKWDAGRWGTALRDWGAGWEYRRIQEDASGQVQIYTASYPCTQPMPICVSAEAGVVHWRNRDTGVVWPIGFGVGGPSDNGEWAMTATDVPTPLGPELRRVRLMDGRTEIVVDTSRMERKPVRRMIADDGTIAFASSGILRVWRPDSTQLEQTRLEPPFESYVIDAKGEFVLGVGGGFRWEGREALWDTLYKLDVRTKERTVVVQTELGIEQPDLASDGHTTVFVSAANWEGKNPEFRKQVWLVDLWTGVKEQLTSETANVKEVSLAGNASAAFAVTENSRVVRIDLASRQVVEIAPEFPRILAKDPVTSQWAQGGRYWLWGRGFGDAEILVGDRPVEITAQGPDDVECLVPWDARTGEAQVRVGSKGSPFQPAGAGLSVAPVSPAFLGSGGRGVTWLHVDGATPVTEANPARLGETVTARMTGMGPVDAARNTTAAVEWSLVESTPGFRGGRFYFATPVPVLQSRVTDQAGVYAVVIRLPESLRGGDHRYEGIRAKPTGGQPAPLSPLPLRVE